MYATADYSKDTTAYMWFAENVKEIAERIYKRDLKQVMDSAGTVLNHLEKKKSFITNTPVLMSWGTLK